MQKKAQVTLFIIIAVIVLAAALFSFFYFRQPIINIPSEIRPVENYFIDCVSEHVKEASKIAGMQAGYLEMPEFEAGSEHMPFSSRLDFLGMEVPYWFYVSGNNLAREKRPEIVDIEKQFSNYLTKKIQECNLDDFVNKGYEIEKENEPVISVDIKENSIETNVYWPFVISFDETTSRINEHKVSTKSNFGSLYETANTIYEAEQDKYFLDNYALDVLRLYAPNTGIELSCAPKTWLVSEIKDEINQALEGNIGAVKVSGNYYRLASSENKYFEVDVGRKISENVYFLYSRNMPQVFEVWPSENDLMMAEPIGNQPGLGLLGSIGFCYVPYHFIYDLKFPVMVQIIDGENIFQFPVLIMIDKNTIRNVSEVESGEVVFDICDHKTQQATIFTYDENSAPLKADIGYKCFNQICDVGKTTLKEGKASLTTLLPQCYNGFLIAKAPDYITSKLQVSSTESFVTNIFLNPIHTFDVEINLGSNENAVINFVSDDYSTTLYYPEQKTVTLAEGTYEISVQLFKESSITLEAQTVEKCIKIPEGGVAGMFGAMQEQCFDLEIPAESLTNVLFGGGSTEFSVTESELSSNSKIKIDVPSFDVPKDVLELTDIYSIIELSEVQISLS